MTTRDARRALREMASLLDDQHVEQVREMIEEAEATQEDADDTL